MKSMRFVLYLVVLSAMILAAACGPAPTPQIIEKVVEKTTIVESTRVVEVEVQVPVQVTEVPQPVKLTMLTHWGEESLMKPMQAKLDEYMALNPHVTIEYQAVTFDQLLPKIATARAAGISPDIYHFYNLWMPDFAKGGMLAVPPLDVLEDIKANYTPGSLQAVTYADTIWGYPTEINTYQLVYNKKMLKDAGYDKPPATLAELAEYTCKLTKSSGGKVEVAGMALMPGWDSGVVHPFLSLLWSASGQYVADDLSAALFDSPEGLSVLKYYTDMITQKCIDPAIGSFNDFVTGKAAMIIMANWFRSTLQASFVDGYENVGVAQIPTSGSGTPTALQYNWLWGVDNGSPNRDEAWKLVKWLNTPTAEGQASPMGDYLTSALGAIPSRTSDQMALKDRLSDEFMTAYVASAATAKPEPVYAGGQEVKTALQTEVEAAWYGKKTPEDALKTAAEEANRILGENK